MQLKNSLCSIDTEDHWIPPDPRATVTEDGLIGISVGLAPKMYARMYTLGIFPWFNEDEVVCWFSPPIRSITFTNEVRIAKSMRPFINQRKWRFSVNTAFDRVVEACKEAQRPGQRGTWISSVFEDNFNDMHRLGMAHSFEVWDNDRLVGGTFGVMSGRLFVGESMYHGETNAYKFAYIGMCQYLEQLGVVAVDNQLPTNHLSSLGAQNISRDYFLSLLKDISSEHSRVEVPETDSFFLKVQ